MKNLLLKWRKLHYARRFQEGYAWAAGELLSRRMSADDVEQHCVNPWDYPSTRPFDHGALQATRDWYAATGEE